MVTLMLMRQMYEYNKVINARCWVQDLPLRSIAGSSIAVIGTGDIGRNAAERYRALGAESVTGFSRSGRPAEGFDEVFRIDQYEEVMSREKYDVLLLCVPGTPESEGLLSRDRIAMLSEKTFVINVGRGTAIDQDALIDALNEGAIAGAALDVVYPEPLPEDHPLWTTKNLILTPHISGDMGLPYTVDLTVEIFCDNLRRFARGEEMTHVVDINAGY
jgi:phosphoglycerate dehydrogenase-like enzyme